MSRFRSSGMVVLVVGILAACGGAAPATSTEAAESEAPTASASAAADGAVTSLDGVESATIQIVAEGTFQDPEVGLVYNAAGSGSGFIIDPSGIAVTNNHVVTGAALLQVFVGGEDEPRNARVLGVSECSDLAVIDLEGDGYPFLAWYEDDLRTGLDVYAAGFPLGDPEFTLTRGIVSKAEADGETSWASVDTVIEHDANIQPGNSGGPLVTADGRVAGINYAGGSPTNTDQFFAISPEGAIPIVERLRADENVDSIGVNGQAVSDEQVSGIWVASVDSGSPADEAGVMGGDIVTALEGLLLATDGTMSDYCDILRSHDPTDTLSIEVLRYSTEEVLEGQLNGRPLETSFSFAQELDEEVEEGGGGSGPSTYSEYLEVDDGTGTIVMSVPAEWTEVQGARWVIGGVDYGPSITVSPDIQAWVDGWATPGVFFGASSTLRSDFDVPAVLDADDFSSVCTYDARYDYEDPLYVGAYDVYTECGGEGSTFIALAAEPEDGSFIMLLQIVLVDEADLEALDQILNTFQVVGEL